MHCQLFNSRLYFLHNCNNLRRDEAMPIVALCLGHLEAYNVGYQPSVCKANKQLYSTVNWKSVVLNLS